MISLEYSSEFVRRYKKLEPAQRAEVLSRLEEFKDTRKHRALLVHKLKGPMKGLFAFSVNYRDRIIFEWSNNRKIAYLLDIGDHSIYE